LNTNIFLINNIYIQAVL